MRKFLIGCLLLAGLVAIALWVLSRPMPLADDAMAGLTGDPVNGETVFWAGGCASCHADPDAKGEDKLILSGGYRIVSPFGTFIAPNISPGPAGLEGWNALDLANALKAGVSPERTHLYPSLPYTTYIRMTLQDVADLKSFLDTLPVSERPSLAHELSFPFNIRRGLGLWKQLNLTSAWILTAPSDPEIERGRYLVEALGHCGECHSPRDVTGGLDRSRWMQGAPNPSGKGKIPAIDPQSLKWSASDIAYYLETGFTPDYDSAGGQMTKVVQSIAHLSAEDRNAIAAYLKALPGTD
ncbi:cytochrome c [Sedimentitalea todarodis]|uniref:Cytochrome c n=1 Tax=Sedimentitalea todarodis TaxID=1631240 RepID=A0ABU3VAJ4_9RHOB|nr:cytochrome c [Sedimentitalea todarodis]MDU9003196.1 cytochrome c [Sedimentitalea todarodis]